MQKHDEKQGGVLRGVRLKHMDQGRCNTGFWAGSWDVRGEAGGGGWDAGRVVVVEQVLDLRRKRESLAGHDYACHIWPG